MKQRLRSIVSVTILGLTVSFSAVSSAAADVISDRQARFKANNAAMRAMGGALGSGDVATIKAEATRIAEFASVMPDYFPKGSSGGKSSAKDDLWDNFDLFRKQADDNHKAALALIAAADGGDMDKAQGALVALGNSCKACHQNFKGY